MVTGYIKINKFTSGHLEWLKQHDYDASIENVGPEGGKRIVVRGSEFVDHFDCTGTDDELITRLKEFVAAKKLLTYGSSVTLRDGSRLKSIGRMVGKLDQVAEGMSALVVSNKDPIGSSTTKSGTRGQSYPHAAIDARIADLLGQGKIEEAKKLADTKKELLGQDKKDVNQTRIKF